MVKLDRSPYLQPVLENHILADIVWVASGGRRPHHEAEERDCLCRPFGLLVLPQHNNHKKPLKTYTQQQRRHQHQQLRTKRIQQARRSHVCYIAPCINNTWGTHTPASARPMLRKITNSRQHKVQAQQRILRPRCTTTQSKERFRCDTTNTRAKITK